LVSGGLATPLAALALFRARPGLDPQMMHFALHFWIVGGTASAAAIACAVLIASARSLRETRLLFLALAFVSIAGIFSVHGIMTPGFIADELYATVPISGWVSVAAGALFVALSAVELPRRADEFVRRAGGAIFAWTVVALGAYILLSIEMDNWLDWIPADSRGLQYATAAGCTALFGFAIWRYWQAYLFARLPAQAAIVAALVLLAEVPAIILWGRVWHLSWWTYHATYAAAFAVLFAGWAVEARRAGSLRAISDALSMRDALAQLNRGRDAHLLHLVDEIEAKDAATLGHVNRVAAHALAIGKQLGLPALELRSLVLAAQMHDVGKIGVPDAILLKPGPLTASEFREVQRHTQRGFEIARHVEVLRPLAPVIRAHHERLNGQGYPDGLAGDDIPLLARIIGVADTFDAMTSARPYRSALSPEAAAAELRRVSGTELDPQCVDALLAVLSGAEQSAA
jgi:HD-GYP domain-containing protein (c-di-GMP phosphodiesterase class II)